MKNQNYRFSEVDLFRNKNHCSYCNPDFLYSPKSSSQFFHLKLNYRYRNDQIKKYLILVFPQAKLLFTQLPSSTAIMLRSSVSFFLFYRLTHWEDQQTTQWLQIPNVDISPRSLIQFQIMIYSHRGRDKKKAFMEFQWKKKTSISKFSGSLVPYHRTTTSCFPEFLIRQWWFNWPIRLRDKI